jgi:hypothetical protein
MPVVRRGEIATVAANGDHWEENWTDINRILSCDLHATSSGQINCVNIDAAYGPGGITYASITTLPVSFGTTLLVVETS